MPWSWKTSWPGWGDWVRREGEREGGREAGKKEGRDVRPLRALILFPFSLHNVRLGAAAERRRHSSGGGNGKRGTPPPLPFPSLPFPALPSLPPSLSFSSFSFLPPFPPVRLSLPSPPRPRPSSATPCLATTTARAFRSFRRWCARREGRKEGGREGRKKGRREGGREGKREGRKGRIASPRAADLIPPFDQITGSPSS